MSKYKNFFYRIRILLKALIIEQQILSKFCFIILLYFSLNCKIFAASNDYFFCPAVNLKEVSATAISDNGYLIATTSIELNPYSWHFKVINQKKSNFEYLLRDSLFAVTCKCLKFFDNDTKLLSTNIDQNNVLKFFQINLSDSSIAETGTEIDSIVSVYASKDAKLISAQNKSNRIILYDIANDNFIDTLNKSGINLVEEIIFSDDGSLMAYTAHDSIFIYRTTDMSFISVISSFGLDISRVRFFPDNKRILKYRSDDRSFRIYDIFSDSLLNYFTIPGQVHESIPSDVIVTLDNHAIILKSSNDSSKICDLTTGNVAGTFNFSAIFSGFKIPQSNDPYFGIVSAEGIILWNYKTDEIVSPISIGNAYPDFICNDKYLFYNSGYLFDTGSWKFLKRTRSTNLIPGQQAYYYDSSSVTKIADLISDAILDTFRFSIDDNYQNKYFFPLFDYLAGINKSSLLTMWDWKNKTKMYSLDSVVWMIIPSQNGKYFFCDEDYYFKTTIRRTSDGSLIYNCPAGYGYQFSKDEKYLVCNRLDTLKIIDFLSGTVTKQIVLTDSMKNYFINPANLKYLVFSNTDSLSNYKFNFYNLENQQVDYSVPLYLPYGMSNFSFTDNFKYLVIKLFDGTIMVYDSGFPDEVKENGLNDSPDISIVPNILNKNANLILLITLTEPAEYRFEICNILGEILCSSKQEYFQAGQNEYDFPFTFGNYPTSCYYVRVFSGIKLIKSLPFLILR